MKRTFYHGLAIFLFYVILSLISVAVRNPKPLMSSIAVTIMTFLWFRMSVDWEKFLTTTNDVFVNIVIYTIILSIVSSLSMIFSNDEISILNVTMYLSSVVVWFVIWTDYFFQKMKGKI